MSKPALKLIEKPHHLGHRKRLRDRFLKRGVKDMADYELLEMVLFAAIPRGDTKPIAKDLLKRFHTFAGVISADIEDLKQVSGIGESAAAAIKIVEAAALRLKHDRVIKQPIINSWQAILDYCEASLKYKKEEEFRVLFVDKKNQLIADELQQQGTVDQAPVYPREIIKRALELKASALILVHNHPTGDPTPSPQDVEMTQHVVKAAEVMGIKVHDHVIIGKETYTSFKSLGMI